MFTLKEAREKCVALFAKMDEIIKAAESETRELTDAEVDAYNVIKGEYDEACQVRDGLDRRASISSNHNQTAKAMKEVKPSVTQGQGVVCPVADHNREFETIGEFIHAVRFNKNDQRLVWHENQDPQAKQSMSEGDKGGFQVPTRLIAGIKQVEPQEAIMRPRAEVIPAGSPPDGAITMAALDQTGTTPQNMYGGVQVNWIAEGGQKPETDFGLRQITWEPKEVAGYIRVTDKLLRNWQAAGPMIERLLRGATIQAEDTAFLRGDGINRPLGVINSGAAYKVNRAVSNDITYDDLVEMVAHGKMEPGAIWVAAQSILPKLMTMRNYSSDSPSLGDGALIWQQSLIEGQPDRLLGRPILYNERSPSLGTKGDLTLLVPSYYVIKDGSGPFVSASEHVHFLTNETVIKVFWNVDGRPWLTAPIKTESNYEISPFVVLDIPG